MDGSEAVVRPIDPSLYVHRFVDKMEMGSKAGLVVTTTLRLIASMRRDWMITGRRPAGVLGAALYLAAHIHGFRDVRKLDIIKIVHVGQNTLQLRLNELGSTRTGKLKPDEFNQQAQEYEQYMENLEQNVPEMSIQDPQFKCSHIVKEESDMFALGLCKACFLDMAKITPDFIDGGKDPPAYLRGIRKLKKQKKQKQKDKRVKKKAEEDEAEEEATIAQEEQVQEFDNLEQLSKQFEPFEEQEQVQDIQQQTKGVEDAMLYDSQLATIEREDEFLEDNSMVAYQTQELEQEASSDSLTSQLHQTEQEVQQSQEPGDTQVEVQMVGTQQQQQQQERELKDKSQKDGDEAEDAFEFGGEENEDQQKQIQVVDGDGESQEESDAFDMEDGEDEEQGIEESLSDVSGIDEYIATKAEANVKRKFWELEFQEWEAEQKIKEQIRKEQGDKKPTSQRKKRQKRIEAPPADSAKGAVEALLKKKGLSNRINYDAFENLFKDGIGASKIGDEDKDKDKGTIELVKKTQEGGGDMDFFGMDLIGL
eukprot:TRINITY_DN2890_c0_g1_i8.p1 TRINITY_DN2890_c0_g1~~TRINITY_DN2890_c0_g1_i8.p1  ORF type:complete len:603 (+),score=142.05 TRINITY_DN2890_c0_g1_i8:204-1811(+)